MTRPAEPVLPPAASAPHQPARAPVPVLAHGLTVAGLAALAVITLASPGATRMFAWPWSLASAAALLAPMLGLTWRAFDARRPLALPPTAWCALAGATAAVVLASALASPHRGPSLLWSAPLLAGIAFFFVVFDWLSAGPDRRGQLANLTGLAFGAIALTSLGLWLGDLPGRTLAEVAAARNPYPLGHSNYTAGLALLALPWFAQLGLRAPRPARFAWAAAIGLALAMLFTSGSRGGLLGLATLALALLVVTPLDRSGKIRLGLGLALIGLALALAHPRTRAMFAPADPAAPPNISNVQRTAMLTAGWRLGTDRPLLGWGPGTTPLVFPRYRAGLEGGAENVLQLHSTPVQLWAEFGAAGVVCALVFAALVWRNASRHPVAASALAGYGVFALTDWQLDVPIFAFAVAAGAAALAPPGNGHASPGASLRQRRALGAAALLVLALVALAGRRDPTPEMNVRALALAREPAGADRAISLFRESLALNPDQELAHFNLGWLLVVREPVAAERHFLAAAHLVPDKGGVYFGLGLARLNQNHRATAASAFALECLNDPAFLASPWWREPAIAAVRDATAAELLRLAATARPALPPRTFAATQLARIASLAPQLGRAPAGPERVFRRERTGYPVLMRNLDLPTPVDLFDVREPAAPADATLPAKGWLPSPLLLTLLNAPGTTALPAASNR